MNKPIEIYQFLRNIGFEHGGFYEYIDIPPDGGFPNAPNISLTKGTSDVLIIRGTEVGKWHFSLGIEERPTLTLVWSRDRHEYTFNIVKEFFKTEWRKHKLEQL